MILLIVLSWAFKWERVCTALREMNKHRDIVTQFRKEDALGRTIKSTG
ncbi:DUF1627 domain-containing protein [Citrobacter freundii]|nr:DUF1627 domain-containing protein [Citrobacter freundii]QMG40974.1 DUF1627 domain-containing protein [Citrobacter freundii]